MKAIKIERTAPNTYKVSSEIIDDICTHREYKRADAALKYALYIADVEHLVCDIAMADMLHFIKAGNVLTWHQPPIVRDLRATVRGIQAEIALVVVRIKDEKPTPHHIEESRISATWDQDGLWTARAGEMTARAQGPITALVQLAWRLGAKYGE